LVPRVGMVTRMHGSLLRNSTANYYLDAYALAAVGALKHGGHPFVGGAQLQGDPLHVTAAATRAAPSRGGQSCFERDLESVQLGAQRGHRSVRLGRRLVLHHGVLADEGHLAGLASSQQLLGGWAMTQRPQDGIELARVGLGLEFAPQGDAELHSDADARSLFGVALGSSRISHIIAEPSSDDLAAAQSSE